MNFNSPLLHTLKKSGTDSSAASISVTQGPTRWEHGAAKQWAFVLPAHNAIQTHSNKGFGGSNPEIYRIMLVPSKEGPQR